jgi:DNA-binding NtrC family response regulator
MSLLRRVVVVSKDVELQQLAQQVGQEIFVADDLAEALDIVEAVNPELTVFDDSFTPSHIREFLDKLVLSGVEGTDKNSRNVPVVVIWGDARDAGARAQFIQMGAYDYVQKSTDCNQLRQIAAGINNLPKTGGPDPFDELKTDLSPSPFFVDEHAAAVSMVGRSRAFVKTLGMIRLVAASNCNPVLIVGETGTGKELAAKAVHALRSPDGQFVAVNCAALTANLLESELFGHVKGSFTSADREKIGLLELAGCGTILLDEIGEMPSDLQAKLLRVLQEKTFRKVGGIKDIPCNATIIASSNRNLYQEMKANRFRRDLYYRLNICPVLIAPLRSPDRREDIPLLAEYFLQASTICPEKSQKIMCLTKFAMEALEKHDWPGNVREVRNVIDRAVLFETTDKIGLSSIVFDPAECDEFAESQSGVPRQLDSLRQSPFNWADGSGGAGQLVRDFSLAKAERELIARALQETGWQKTQAATLLGITRATLYAKVKQYNIRKDLSTRQELPRDVPELSRLQPATA